jgi:hypothetical protein
MTGIILLDNRFVGLFFQLRMKVTERMLEKLNAVQSRYNELTRLLEENPQDYQRVA